MYTSIRVVTQSYILGKSGPGIVEYTSIRVVTQSYILGKSGPGIVVYTPALG